MRRSKLAWGLAGAASLCIALASAVPASAASGSGVTFWSGDFRGQSVTLPASTECTTLPFPARSEFNDTTYKIAVYGTTDCTGNGWVYPPTDIHSFVVGFEGRSFRIFE
ncbi:hypothetical protein [Nonomuraea aridisoli]|uniref:Uncharacterized protein n=1 Tax=Nonomuraea aridisoli TaxID=2070368 RepID=A0A2W2E0Z0_9ACTN|nr:hypothetical protein [Nonomuraea aridisoli]PZG17642.1 hypothetical protein C1J01_17385 [Nonomuraea aridisoli]